MWKSLSQSVQGVSHQRVNQPCQDSCAAREIERDGESLLILTCSDGAGSAELSQVGSRLACAALVDLVAAELREGALLDQVSHAQTLDWLRQVHKAIAAEADARHVDVRQLACTLLFAVVGPAHAVFGQVGDGAIVVWQDGQYQNVFWPQSGEYVNSTNFITDSRFESFLEFARHDGPLDELALFTDGLQMLGLDFRQRRAHGPFFAPLFAALRAAARPEELVGPLCDFLQSRPVVERTDDDKTLILATRVAL